MKHKSLLLLTVAVGIGIALPLMGQKQDAATEAKRAMFLPPPLTDDWTKWIVGEWEGSGESDTGKGRGTARFELALNGQFLVLTGEATITELNPEYLKKHMNASDEEIERFKRSGYRSLEVYTIDQGSGEVIGFLFDNLRCMAQGRGRREGRTEVVEWQWRTGHKSTRITERASDDKMVIIERTRNTDGSVMEDKGEMSRAKRKSVSEKR